MRDQIKNRPSPVLYVEDEENDILFMRLAFKRSGLENPLETVGDGQQAIDYLIGAGSFADREKFPFPCLVLLDLNLPIKSGFEVLRWARQQAFLEGLPIVVFTSSPQERDLQIATESGAAGYMIKPTSPARLVDLIHEIQERWLVSRSF